MNQCANCNSQIEAEQVICINCGFNQLSGKALKQDVPEANKKKLPTLLIGIIGIALLIPIVIGLNSLANRNLVDPLKGVYEIEVLYEDKYDPSSNLDFKLENVKFSKAILEEAKTLGIKDQEVFSNNFSYKIKYTYNLPNIQNRSAKLTYDGMGDVKAEISLSFNEKLFFQKQYKSEFPPEVKVESLFNAEDGVKNGLLFDCQKMIREDFKRDLKRAFKLISATEEVADTLAIPQSMGTYKLSLEFNNQLLLSDLPEEVLDEAITLEESNFKKNSDRRSRTFKNHWGALFKNFKNPKVQKLFKQLIESGDDFHHECLEDLLCDTEIMVFLLKNYLSYSNKEKENYRKLESMYQFIMVGVNKLSPSQKSDIFKALPVMEEPDHRLKLIHELLGVSK